MSRPIRMVLAVLLIIFLYFIWTYLGSVLFGWRFGGGMIPTLIFISMATFVWRTLTKKEEQKSLEEKQVLEIEKESGAWTIMKY